MILAEGPPGRNVHAGFESVTAAQTSKTWEKVVSLGLLATGFVALVLALWPSESRRDGFAGHNDFAAFYVGAKLAGSSDLYSSEANARVLARFVGMRSKAVRYLRLPFYALLLKPLAALPYRAAYLIFQALSLAALVGAVGLLARGDTAVLLLACMSMPMAATLLFGQDVGLVALAYAAFYRLSQQGRGFPAGLALSLCLLKFHLFPLTALALLVRSEWPVVRGAVVGCGILLALSFTAGGAGWSSAFWNLMWSPQVSPGAQSMPNLHGLSSIFGWSRTAEVAAMAAVVGAFLLLLARHAERNVIYCFALICGLLLSVHAYMADATLLLLAFALLGSAPRVALTRKLLLVSLTPIPYLLLIPGTPRSIVLVCLLIATIASAIASLGWRDAFRPLPERVADGE